MNIIISAKKSKHTSKTYYYFEWGKAKGQRIATGIFTYTKPKDQVQKNHNKEALQILETKRSQMLLDHQSIASGYVPRHKIKTNFLDYYRDYVTSNKTTGNRHLYYSLEAFKKFIKADYISASDITENLCEQFRNYLVKNLKGETPSGYFMRFKKVLKAATKTGYFKNSPAEDLAAKTNPVKRIKNILTEEEYVRLLNTPCLNYEIKKAFVFSLYTGLRWADVKPLQWEHIKENWLEIYQKKTGQLLQLPLHPIAIEIIGVRKKGNVFHLPSQEGAYRILVKWSMDAGLNKHITWHCARHSFSVILQLKGIDLATVAGMLGHTSTKYVQQTYKRYILSSAKEAIHHLPAIEK